MKKIKLHKILDSIFRVLIIFLLYLVWCRYFIKSLVLSLAVTAVFSLLTEFSIRYFKTKKAIKNNIKTEELETAKSYINTFIFGNSANTLDFFYKLASTKHQSAKKKNYIVITHPCSKIILYPIFLYRSFSADDLIEIYKKTSSELPTRLVICTNNYDASAQKLSKKMNTEIVLLDEKDTYFRLLKKYQVYPESTKLKEDKQTSLKDILEYSLNRKRTKGYFLSSVLMLFSSFIVRYQLYYVIFASILLLLSIISFSNPKFNKKKAEILLEA